MYVWKGIIIVGGYSIQALVYYPKQSEGAGDLYSWHGTGKVSSEHLLKRLSKNLNTSLETNVGAISVTHISQDGSIEFQGVSKPRSYLARDIYRTV